mmetsp:Transcript_6621/g.24583  ORF Transcript_6621/g.24583 Transcript_6621/m.24583 type:complete len:217 (-) Transcript_6621:1372-2022(-)
MEHGNDTIEHYARLARESTGGAVAEIIGNATEHPNLYAFGELLEVPSVQALSADAQFKHCFDLLNLFAFGTWSDYRGQRASLPELSPAQTQKLKYLTVLTLAEQSGEQRMISYDDLFLALSVENVRELEDLVINCMYAGILQGKLDQQKRRLVVHSSIGRDLRREQLEEMSNVLGVWVASSEQLLAKIEERISCATKELEAKAASRKEVAEKIEEV